MSFFRRIIKMLRRKIKKEIPKGDWIAVDYSDYAKERCTTIPKVMIFMRGDREVSKVLYDPELFEWYAKRIPAVPLIRIHPCFKPPTRYTAFGYLKFRRFEP